MCRRECVEFVMILSVCNRRVCMCVMIFQCVGGECVCA